LAGDRGASWTLLDSLWNRPERKKWFGGGYDSPGIHSICIHPRNSRLLRLAVSCGGVWESDVGGHNWSEIHNVEPSAFGFAVAVHPTDPETAWFVPGVKDEYRVPVDGRLVVNRTRDGGATFEQLTSGLPRTKAWDLVYRHALAIDATGEVMAFGSTTVNLWLSENQGDDWQCLSNHLPPISVVRFE